MNSFSMAGWLQGIQTQCLRSFARRIPRRATTTNRSPSAQQLENRYVLSAFTVNTTLDTVDANPGDGLALDSNGNTSLRAAVMEANAGAGADTITLPAGVYQLTISPTTGSTAAVDGDLDLAANSGISIVGAGRDLTIIDGGGLDRIFEVPATAALQLGAVTLRNGLADSGGAISSIGDLRITDSRLTGNRGRFRGGAIDTTAGQLSIQQSKLDLNLASESANPATLLGNGLGGGVSAFATSISVNGSEFLGNKSAGEGGAFSIQASTGFFVQGSTFNGNFSQNGGSLRVVNSSGTLTGNLYQNERATTQGGAIYSSNSSIGLFRNVFDDVRLTNGFRGGVIYVNSFSNTVQIINSEFKNSGSATGGGIYQASGTIEIRQTLFDTVSGGQGGALFNANGATATIINTTFFGGTGSLGGAIYNEGTINMSHTTISGNTSVGLTAPGGAVFNASTGTLTIGNSIIAANVANRDVVGTIASLGGNVIGAAPATAFTNATDKKGTTTAPLDPQLLPLALNQWFVRTMAIRPTSPARDAGQLLTLPLGWPTDARQIDRSGLRPDAGAYEYQNQAPSISNYSATFDEDQVFVGQLPGTDPDGDTLTYTLTSPPPPGQFSLSPNGSFTYTPPANANGLVFFGFKATDGIVTTTAALATLTISPVNDAPVFDDQSFSIEENSPAGTLIGFFQTTDIDSSSLTYSIISGNEDDGFAFSPFGAIGVAKPEAFNYATNPVRTLVVQVTDNGSPALSDTAIITVKVTSSNRAPDAQDDSANIFEDNSIAIPVLANDSDPDGNTITISSLTQPGHGTATINADGTIQYVPAANFNGTDSLTYTISDPLGRTDIATVTITVAPVNDFPVGVEDFVVVDEDGSATFDVIANDTDVDGDILSFVRVVAFSHGTVVVNSNGTLTYTPDANYNGPAEISYLLSDPSGFQSGGHVTITINSVNDAPVGSNDSAVVDEDNSVVINVLANDSDVDGDALSVSSIGLIDHGTVVINSDNTLTYTPPANYFGPATFSYFMKDPSGAIGSAVVTLTVNSVNDIPVAVEDFVTTDEDNTVTFSPVDNDTDADGDILTVLAVGRADHGTTTVNADGTVSYVPQPNFFGTDAFFYRASDGHGGDAFGIIRVTVQSVNDAPVANNDSATLFEDGYAIIYVLGNDSDIDGDILSIQSVGLIDHGSVTINADRSLTYTPPANYNGQAHFTYFVQDPSGAVSSAIATLTVVPVNDYPVIVDDTVTTNEDTPITISPLANDSDVDGDTLTVISVSNGDHGTASINPDGTVKYVPEPNFFGTDAFFYLASDGNGGDTFGTIRVTVQSVNDTPVANNDSATLFEDGYAIIYVLGNDSDIDGDVLSIQSVGLIDYGSVTINADRSLTYTPPANYNGQAHFTYFVQDPSGAVSSAIATLTVVPVNDFPVIVDDTVTTNEDTPITISPLSNDSDIDGDTLTVISVSNGDHGTASINPDGTVKYVPEPNFFGTDAFFYLASDGNGGDTFGTIRVTVQSVNDAPVGTNDSAVLNEDSSVTINVLANDTDVDGDILSIHSVVLIDRGSVRINANNTLTYTPPANYNGPARFTYLMKDPAGLVGSAVVTLTVRPVNDAPVANAGPDKTSSEGASVSFSGSLSSDVDGDALTYSWTFGDGQTGSGIAPSHVYADNGVYAVTLKVTDPSGSFSTDTLLVTVSNVAPVATLSGTASGVRGQARTFVVSASDVSSVDQNAQFTYRVTWGDGTSSVVSGGNAGVSLEHVYTSAGTFIVRATTVDKDGAESAAKTQSIIIRVVELQSGVLAIGGATISDAISLEPTNTSGAVSVVVNGTSYGSFTAVSEILIFGQAGNDDIRLQSKKFGSTTARIGVPTTVFGDDGNDVIDVSATTGNNILLGGSGSDSLFGGTGRDILIGGLGADLMYGGDGDDLLIAGYTTFDASLTSLNAIRSEWTSGRTYATRIANLRGTGTGVRNNGSTFLSSSSVLNDTNIDRLFGESGLDWFWGKVNQDLFQDRSSSSEALN